MTLKTAAMQVSLSLVGPQRERIALIATFSRGFRRMLVHGDHKTGERDYVEHIVVKHGLEGRDLSGLQIIQIEARHFARGYVALPLHVENVSFERLEAAIGKLPLPEAPRAVYQIAMQNIP